MKCGIGAFLTSLVGRTTIRSQVVVLLIVSQMFAHAITVFVVSGALIDDEKKRQLRIDISDVFIGVLTIMDPETTTSGARAVQQIEAGDQRFELRTDTPPETQYSADLSKLIQGAVPPRWSTRVDAYLLTGDVDWPGPRMQPFAFRAQLSDGSSIWFYPSPNVLARTIPVVAAMLVIFIIGVPLTLLAIWAGAFVVGPVVRLGQGARRFANDTQAAALEPGGPQEVRDAIVAFNQMQSKLRQLMEERGQTLASIGHDMRTPLTRLKLRLENADLGESLDGVHRDISSLGAMIDDALEFLRSESKHVELGPVRLHSLCQTVIDDFEDQGHRITLSGQTQIDAICDIALTLRSVNNVVGNAVKYAGGAAIKLSEDVEENFVEISVSDSGPGIPADLREIVLRPFNRLALTDAGAEDAPLGFGLGLAIAKECIERQGGELLLKDNHPSGLIVNLRLPRRHK